MKPVLEHLPRTKDESFVVRYFDYKYYPTPWHYHPEMEIVLVTESAGKRFIGDHIMDYKPGNLAFIGPNIPHTYKSDDKYYKANSKLRAKSIVIHFTEESLGEDFLKLPEIVILKQLFIQASCGLDITGKTNRRVSEKLHEIVTLEGFKRWVCLIEILYEMAIAKKDISRITNGLYIGYNEKESVRLENVFKWVAANIEKEIKLTDAAKIAKMHPDAFSRFFSLRTRKPFFTYVQELRLQKAAKLITEEDLSITEICFECGYNNVSNFNRQFLNYYHMNPSKYKKLFLRKM